MCTLFVLCQKFGLPSMPSFPPPFLSIASTLSELKWAITSPKKGQAMQRYHEEQSARSKGARLSSLDFRFGRIQGFHHLTPQKGTARRGRFVPGHFQVTVCGVACCPFSQHDGITNPNNLKARLKPLPLLLP